MKLWFNEEMCGLVKQVSSKGSAAYPFLLHLLSLVSPTLRVLPPRRSPQAQHNADRIAMRRRADIDVPREPVA